MTRDKDTNKYIMEAKCLKKCMKFYNGIVIYGIGEYGKKIVDFIICHGAKDKIKAIVVTERMHAEPEYEGIQIAEAQTFFSDNKNRRYCSRGGGVLYYCGSIFKISGRNHYDIR